MVQVGQGQPLEDLAEVVDEGEEVQTVENQEAVL